MKKLLIILTAACLMGCAAVPAYNGHNQAEIDRVEKINKRWYWITITAIAIIPYSVYESSNPHHHTCQPHEDCYHPIN